MTGAASPPRRRTGPGRSALPAIALAYLLLGLGYSLATPVGEGIDESSHLAYVQFLQQERRLPLPADAHGLITDQVKHPPLYYLALAVATWPGRFEGLSWVPNPHCCNLERPSPAVMRHGEGDRFPYAPAYRLVRRARFLTLLMGLAVVWATWATARLTLPERPEVATAAAAVVAFLPQLIFMQGIVNNDGLANALGALALWAALRVALEGAGRRDLLLLGTFLGLGLITKLTLLAYLAVAVLAVGIAAWRARSAVVLVRATMWTALPLAAVSGWWFAWNLVAKGDLLGWGPWMEAAGFLRRKVPLSQELPDYLAIQWQSFWGRFGWVTVPLPDGIYRLLLLLTALAALGLGLAAARWRRERRAADAAGTRAALERDGWAALVIGATALLVYASVFRLAFTFDLTVAQGRYLFTALPAFGIAFAGGLIALAPKRHSARAAAAVTLGMLALALYGLFGVLWPTFRPPSRLTAQDLSSMEHPLAVRFGSGIELMGADLPRGGVGAGDSLTVGLVWRTPRWIDAGYVVFVHLVDSSGRMLGQADVLPRRGLYPTVLWFPDWPWRDAVRVPVAADAAGGAAEVLVGLYRDGEPQNRLPASEGDRAVGDHMSLGRVMVRARTSATVPAAATARGDVLGLADGAGAWRDRIRLEAFEVTTADASVAVDLTLYWRALDALPQDYTVFVHALGPDGAQVAGADAPPGEGRFPTSLWAAGDLVADRHRVLLPAGLRAADISWLVGAYLPATGTRMPARSADGTVWEDGAIELPED